MAAGYSVEGVGERNRDRCAILQRLRYQFNHLVLHLLESDKGAFESSFVITMLSKIHSQSRVIVNDHPQFGTHWFFEQAGASVEVADSVAVGDNHHAPLVMLGESR